MSLLLHVCCAPCLIYPADILNKENIDFTCYFYNHNIHPYREFKSRLDSFILFCSERNYRVIADKDYGLQRFLRSVVFREHERCRLCYSDRLLKTAKHALMNGFSSFSTTLLYSKYQKHEQIRSVAESVSRDLSVPFFYRDFRDGWYEGQNRSRTLELYRQKYCGCVFSEQERWDNGLKKRLKKDLKKNV